MSVKRKSVTPKKLQTLAPGLSLRQLSRLTGIAMPHLSRVVNGKRGLTVRIAARIAKHTGATLDRVVEVLAPAA